MTIVNEKAGEPDTIDEFVEAAKVFDHDNDGKIEVAELRYAMSRLGDPLDDSEVDTLIGMVDPEKSGLVDIVNWANLTWNIKKWNLQLLNFLETKNLGIQTHIQI